MKISRELEVNDNDKFELVDGLIYRREQNFNFVVPEAMITNLIPIYHDEI